VQDLYPANQNYGVVKNTPGRININIDRQPAQERLASIATRSIYNQDLDLIVINSVQGEFYVIDHGNTFMPGLPDVPSRLRHRRRAISSIASAGPGQIQSGEPARPS